MLVVGGNAFGGTPDHYAKPKVVGFSSSVTGTPSIASITESANAWKTYLDTWKVGGTYDKPLDTANYYTKLNSQLCTSGHDTCKNNVKAGDGTYDDERAIVLDIAREVYLNGAMFCTTQIQAANVNGRQWTWLDYYTNTNYNGQCKTYCKAGYDPLNKCEPLTETVCEQPANNVFNSHDIIGSGGESGRFTSTMYVFGFENETGAGESNQPAGDKKTRHIVLAITKKDSSGKGVIVAPVEIYGERGGTPMQSWVTQAKSNGKFTVLCPQGYAVDNTGLKCGEQSSACKEAEHLTNMCADFMTGYDPTVHSLKKVGSCYEYRCKLAGYGFKANTKECEQCGDDLRSGVLSSNGECKTCDIGNCFRNGKCGDCRLVAPKLQFTRGKNYDTTDKECWREVDLNKFRDCVLCDPGQCWIKVRNGTYNCGSCD